MKKRFSSCLVITALVLLISAGSAFAAGDTGNYISSKVGVGYQGMVAGSFLNGLSVRGWMGDRFGLEGNVFYGRVDANIEHGSETMDLAKADLLMVEAKAMYAIVAKNYSKFYVGGKFGYGRLGFTDAPGSIDGSSVLTPGLFIGSEWSFPQLPEVGFNFDVGYTWFLYNTKVNEDPYLYLNLDMSGVNATFGIHYYF